MGTGQMMLVIGALVLLGITILTVNNNNLDQGSILRGTELGIYATSLATSYMERACGLDFDENSVGTNSVSSTTQLSTTLGRDGGSEVANVDSTFDDFDDYNGLDKIDSVRNVDVFRIKARVYYIDANFNETGTRTFNKRIDLMVSPSVPRNVFDNPTTGVDTVKLAYIFSYFQAN